MTRRRHLAHDHRDTHRTLDLGAPPVIHHRHHTVVHRVVVDGRPVVVKRARGRARVSLRAEAAVLAHLPAAAAPALVSIRETDDHTDLVLEDAGRLDLSEPGRLDDRSLRRALAATVELIDQLHRSGWVHGALCAEHVVLDQDHRPTLCSVGSARRCTQDEVAEERGQLVSLITGALDRHAASDRPSNERRASRLLAERIRRAPTPNGPLGVDAVLELLAPSVQPSKSRRWSIPTQLPLGAVTATAALCGLALVLVVSGGAGRPAPPATHDRSETATVIGATATAPVANTSPTSVDRPSPDDGSVTGHVVRHHGRQFAVGRPGDRVVLGDWTCDGTRTPAVLRPRKGEVHVFDEWAEPGMPVTARLIATHLGATELLVDHGACDRLRVRTGDGALVDLTATQGTTTTTTPDDERREEDDR